MPSSINGTPCITLVDSSGAGSGSPSAPLYTRVGGQRSAGVSRLAITTADKCATPAVPTAANVAGTTGSISAGTAVKVGVAARTRFGPSIASAIASLTITSDAINTHIFDLLIATVTGAEFYDVFVSTDAAPKLLGSFTAAQVAAGNFQMLTLSSGAGVVTTGGGAAAGHVTIGALGTAANQTSATSYTTNNAWVISQSLTPTDINGAVIPVLAAGYATAEVELRVNTPNGLTANLATLLSVFVWNADVGDWFLNASSTRNWCSGAVQTPLLQTLAITNRGAPTCVLMESLTMAAGGSLDAVLVGIF